MLVDLRLQPRAGAARIEGLAADASGAVRLKLRVTAAAEDGRANRAMLKLLARSWDVPASALSLVAGGRARNKTVLLTGDGGALLRRLEAWLGGTCGGSGP